MTTCGVPATLAEAFPGRFMLGLGVSSPVLVEKVRHHDYGKPYSYMEAYLDGHGRGHVLRRRPGTSRPACSPPSARRCCALPAERTGRCAPLPDHARAHRAPLVRSIGPDALLAPEQMVVLETDPAKARADRTARRRLLPAGAGLPGQPAAPGLRRRRLGEPEGGLGPARRRDRRLGRRRRRRGAGPRPPRRRGRPRLRAGAAGRPRDPEPGVARAGERPALKRATLSALTHRDRSTAGPGRGN